MGKHLGVAYNLRLPQELKDKIAESAKELNRSMNADIVARLEDSFELNLDANLKKDIQIALLENKIENMDKFMNTLEGFIEALIKGNGDEYFHDMLEKIPKIKKMYEDGLFDDGDSS